MHLNVTWTISSETEVFFCIQNHQKDSKNENLKLSIREENCHNSNYENNLNKNETIKTIKSYTKTMKVSVL